MQSDGRWAPAHPIIISYLSSSLQVSKVNVWYEENWLGIQVSHCFEESYITLFLQRERTQLSFSCWEDHKVMQL